MKSPKKKALRALIAVFIILLPIVALGQTDAGTDFSDPDSGAVPVDGGVIALVVAGAVYGAKKLHAARNAK